MGQKVNPYGFRLGITTDHVSRWFSDSTKAGQRYSDYVAEDVKIRRMLTTSLDRPGRPMNERPCTRVRVDIQHRPAGHTYRWLVGAEDEASALTFEKLTAKQIPAQQLR